MYNFNKKGFLSVLISPLLFNGLLFGTEGCNKGNNQEKHIKWHNERVLEQKKSNAKPMLEKLGLKDNEYEILGSGAYGMVIKPKSND